MTYDAKQYDRIAEGYQRVADNDPIKRFVQYPELFRMIGDVRDKFVLDAGCGDGRVAKRLAEQGAAVCAFDLSPKQIELANAINKHPHIAYEVNDFRTFPSKPVFDKAVAAMALPYAESEADLQRSFRSMLDALKRGSQLIAVVINGDFWRPGIVAYNRRIQDNFEHEGAQHGIKFEWLDDDGRIIGGGTFPALYSRKQYENAAKLVGFRKVEWQVLLPTEEGRRERGEEYWRTIEQDAPFLGLIATG